MIKPIKYTDSKFLDKAVEMPDGSKAWLTHSRKYYARMERHTPRLITVTMDGWTHIAYYDVKTKERIQLSRAECKECHAIIESKHCGDFVSCPCGKSSVDTDRWFPERHRFIGQATRPAALAEERSKPVPLESR